MRSEDDMRDLFRKEIKPRLAAYPEIRRLQSGNLRLKVHSTEPIRIQTGFFPADGRRMDCLATFSIPRTGTSSGTIRARSCTGSRRRARRRLRSWAKSCAIGGGLLGDAAVQRRRDRRRGANGGQHHRRRVRQPARGLERVGDAAMTETRATPRTDSGGQAEPAGPAVGRGGRRPRQGVGTAALHPRRSGHRTRARPRPARF